MTLLKRLLIGIIILGSIFAGIGFFVPNSKYHLKKFIKSNSLLYDSARKAAEWKHALVTTFSKPESEGSAAQPDFSRRDWQFVFDCSQPIAPARNFWGNLGFESFKGGILNRDTRILFDYMRDTNLRVTGADFQKQAFRYIRAHNLFSDGQPPWGEGCDIYQVDASGRVTFNWNTVDGVFDRILQSGFKPIVEFGFMPDALASIPERRQKWGKANISPPKDYDRWRDLVFETVKHFRERYGDTEVANWYFEVWNEPDLGWVFWVEDSDPNRKPFGDIRAYHKLYDYSVSASKLAFPEIRVGGPASAGGDIELLLEHVTVGDKYYNDSVPIGIDFVSTHTYGKVGSSWNSAKKKGILNSVKWKVDRALNHDHEKVRNAMREAPLLLTEVGPAGDDFPFFNTRYPAAWLVKVVDGLLAMSRAEGDVYLPEEMVYWSGSQVVRQFQAGKGIAVSLKCDGENVVLKRPLFNAFEALAYLKGNYIEMIDGAQFGDAVRGLASADGDRVTLIFYHLNENDRENTSDAVVNVKLSLQKLPFQKFQVQWFGIDESHSNAHSLWNSMGSPNKLSRGQYESLNSRDDLDLMANPWTEEPGDGTFEKAFTLQHNSVALFVLTRI